MSTFSSGFLFLFIAIAILVKKKVPALNQAWWCILTIPALRRLRKKDHLRPAWAITKFKAKLNYIRRICLQKEKEKGASKS